MARNIYSAFSETCKMFPQRTSVKNANRSLTYAELSNQVKCLADHLVFNGVKESDEICILMINSIEVIVSILAIIKLKCTFIPIDLKATKRAERILDSCDSRHILVNDWRVCASFDLSSRNCIEYKAEKVMYDSSTSMSNSNICNNHLYTIFTSGSSGEPKGVKISEANLINYIEWFKSEIGLSEKDSSIITSSFSFDLCYTSIFPILLSGGTLHVIDTEKIIEVQKLYDYIVTEGITYIKITPTLFNIFCKLVILDNRLKKLRYIVLGGEKIRVEDVEYFHNKYPTVKFMNHYGPTECTIGCIAKKINFSEWDMYKKQPTIGKPINGMKAHILDINMNVVNQGEIGEIYIEGEGVGIGYRNKEIETKNRFIRLDENKNQMYRTGDLGVYTITNEILYIGRTDRQVKVRGYRVDLGEAEERINVLLGINSSLLLESIDRCGNVDVILILPIYINESELEVMNILRANLLDYEVPSSIKKIDKLPLTDNRKVDLERLRIITKSDFSSGNQHYSSSEQKVISLYSRVLGLDEGKIDKNSDFFELGGNSLQVVYLSYQIKKSFDLNIEIVDIYSNSRVADLVSKIERNSLISLEEVNKMIVNNTSYEGKLVKVDSPENSGIVLYSKYHSREILEMLEEYRLQKHYPDLILNEAHCGSFNPAETFTTLGGTSVDKTLAEEKYSSELFASAQKFKEEVQYQEIIRLFSTTYKSKRDKGYKSKDARKDMISFSILIKSFDDDDKLASKFEDILNKQSILRTSVKRNPDATGEYLFCEHDNTVLPSLIIHDLTRLSSSQVLNIEKRVIEMFQDALHDTHEANIRFYVTAMRLNRASVKFTFVLDHLISDRDAIRIIREQLSSSIVPISSQYYEYLNTIESYDSSEVENLLVNNKTFEKFCDTNRIFFDTNDFAVRNEAIVLGEPVTIELEIDDTSPLEKALSFTMEHLRNEFNLKDVSIRMFTNNRTWNDSRYRNTIGDFSDTVPLYVPEHVIDGNEIFKKYYEFQEFLNIYGILMKNYKDCNVIYDSYFTTPFSFNFLGDITSEEYSRIKRSLNNLTKIPYPIGSYMVDGKFLVIIIYNGSNRIDISNERSQR